MVADTTDETKADPNSVVGELGAKNVIEDARGYMQLCNSADGDSRNDSLDDLRFLSGQQWPDLVKRQRDVDKRPCLTVNKLPTFLHQVTNDQRMNVPSIKISPVDSNADIKTAEVMQGLIRHIEYSSNADTAYDTAVNSAAAIGFGYFRLVTDYCKPDSFDQDIRFQRIRNSFTVYFDPLSVEADGSDAKRCMITARMTLADFKKEFPDAQTAPSNGFTTGVGDPTTKDWYGADFIRVAEFYRIEETPATLVELSNGETGFKEDLISMPEGITITRERKTMRPKVMWYKITAFEILDQTEIKCKWIPVFPVYGDEIDLDGQVIRSGIVRNAKDPAQMYNFWMTAATEEVALRPKTPYIGAEGQFEGYEDDWNTANVTSYSYLEYKPVTLDGNLAPAPARQPMADMPQGMLTMAMHANDNIKATTGLFDSSLGAMGNARSGTQERSQQRQGDVANFHFTDNLNRSVRHAGRCVVSMIPNYYDGARIIRIMGEDDKIKSVPINQPYQPGPKGQYTLGSQPAAPNMQPGQPPVPGGMQGQATSPPPGQVGPGMQPLPGAPPQQQQPDPQMEAVNTIIHDMTIGEYDLVVKAGPSYSTLREEAADSMIQFGKSWPKLMDVAGDKVIRAMDWPGASEIADRVAKTIPPELRDDDDGQAQNVVNTPKGPIPVDQAAVMLQQMDQQIQQMSQALQEAQSGLTKAKLDNNSRIEQTRQDNAAMLAKAQSDADSRVKVAEIGAVSRSDVAELTGAVQLLLKQIQPPPELEAAVNSDLKSGQSAS